jgi:hypothetical protein
VLRFGEDVQAEDSLEQRRVAERHHAVVIAKLESNRDSTTLGGAAGTVKPIFCRANQLTAGVLAANLRACDGSFS